MNPIGLFPPSSSLLFLLEASKREGEWVVVIPPYSGQKGVPSLEQGHEGGRLGRLSSKESFAGAVETEGQTLEGSPGQEGCFAPGPEEPYSTLDVGNLQFFLTSISHQTTAQPHVQGLKCSLFPEKPLASLLQFLPLNSFYSPTSHPSFSRPQTFGGGGGGAGEGVPCSLSSNPRNSPRDLRGCGFSER